MLDPGVLMATEQPIDLGSPRTQAALKVLGIEPHELKKLDPKDFEGREERYKIFEQKRRNLIEEVKTKVAMSPDISGGRRSIDPAVERAEKNARLLEEVEEQERVNMEKMQLMAKKDVQNVVIGELGIKLSSFQGQKRQKESQQRLKELLKVRDEELQARKKDAQKKQERNQEVRTRATSALTERNEEMVETLRKNSERAEKKLQENADEHQKYIAEVTERRRAISERQGKYELQLMRGREVAYTEHCIKHKEKLDMLAEALAQRQSDAQIIAERQRRSLLNVRETQAKQQSEAEDKFWKICERHGKAAAVRDERFTTTMKEFQVRNNKRKSAHESRFDRLQQEHENSPGLKLTASSAPGSPKFVIDRSDKRRASPGRGENLAMAKSLSDSRISGLVEHRTNFSDLVGANKERLRRAHHHAMTEQIDKLHSMRRRVEIMQEAQTEADRRRMAVMRNCSLEKTHLTERVDRIKDSQDPTKMSKMLEELNPDQDALDTINDMLEEMAMERVGPVKDTEEKR